MICLSSYMHVVSQSLNLCGASRWDKCWIRLLDGMLQLSVAGTRDYELRIPTRIRSIVINNAAGTDDGQITVSHLLSPLYRPLHARNQEAPHYVR